MKDLRRIQLDAMTIYPLFFAIFLFPGVIEDILILSESETWRYCVHMALSLTIAVLGIREIMRRFVRQRKLSGLPTATIYPWAAEGLNGRDWFGALIHFISKDLWECIGSDEPVSLDPRLWFGDQGIPGGVLRIILDANLATTGPVKVHMLDGNVLVETAGLREVVGFEGFTVAKMFKNKGWLESDAPAEDLHGGYEAFIGGKWRNVFALCRGVSEIAMQYAPSLFDGSRNCDAVTATEDAPVTALIRTPAS